MYWIVKTILCPCCLCLWNYNCEGVKNPFVMHINMDIYLKLYSTFGYIRVFLVSRDCSFSVGVFNESKWNVLKCCWIVLLKIIPLRHDNLFHLCNDIFTKLIKRMPKLAIIRQRMIHWYCCRDLTLQYSLQFLLSLLY